jgi:sialate O-acetylesterase
MRIGRLTAGFLSLLACGMALVPAAAAVKLPAVFSSHMVLQREKPLTFWGWAEPNEEITVQLNTQSRSAKANERGEWKVTLPAMTAGGPYKVTVRGSSTVEFEDVMVGEVWLCSGQSNMEMGVGTIQNGKQEVAEANHPGIRLFMVPNRWTPEPQPNVEGSWKLCTPATIAEGGWGGFSAAGFFFGRELHQKLGVAVGLIDATWGGTRIESWTPPEGFAQVEALKRDYELVQLGDPRTQARRQRLGKVVAETEEWLAVARQAMAQGKAVPAMPTYPAELLPPRDVQHATALYNGMIHPLVPFGIRGAIWYQGESNSGEGMHYAERMKALVGGWRHIWGGGSLPFYFVQIAPFNYGGNPERIGEFWEGQAAAARMIPDSGMVVINDIGDLKDIHPANKQEVGRRLALWALARTYGKQDIVCSGPVFKSMSQDGSKLRLTFENAAGGLSSRDRKPLTWFEIIDAEEGGFVPADATIDGSSVVLSAKDVKNPVAMRFAWSMLAEPNLVNSAGLPAGAFRAGPVPKRDSLVLKVPEAKDYQVVYDLDLAKLGPDISYNADLREKVKGGFDRVAYFLELQAADGNTDYVYVSMKAFTDSLDKIGIPTVKCGASFRQEVGELNVYSNVKGVTVGTGLKGGSIEFWPNNYGTGNSAKVPNASNEAYDFGDEPAEPADGYGCMQVHNFAARQTLFAVNHWREGKTADLGIGNQPQGSPDWTFAANAERYTSKRLRVLVRGK